MINIQVNDHRKHNSPFAIQLLECALVAVSLILSFVFAGKLIYNNAFPFGWISGSLMYAMIAAIAIILLGANKYFSFISRQFIETAAKVISLVIMLNFIYIALLYFSRSIQLSLYYFIIIDTLQILFLLMIKRITFLLKTSVFKSRVSLVVGRNIEQNQLIRELKRKTTGRLAFAVYNDDKLKEYIDQADNVFVSGILSKRLKDQVINYCILKEKKVFIIPETYEIAMRKAEMSQVGDIPLFAIESLRLTEAQNLIKRLIDILLAVTGILLSSPIMLYTAIRIKLEDGGPIFYKQVRSGLNGKQFKLIKFRSMVVDAEKNTGPVFAQENDPRITRIGHRIRAARIDEIPQFFNVLMGSMSMIGPRPERPQFVDEFSKELPEYAGRLAVKPGITGLAQVMGNYTTSAENKAKFDLVYIRDYSLLLDLKILFRTIKVVFTKSQSKGFSVDKSMAVYDMEAELAGENLYHEARKSGGHHRLGKAVLVLFCSFIIISGCMILRFSALTSTMMEAAALTATIEAPVEQPVSIQSTSEQVPIDASTTSEAVDILTKAAVVTGTSDTAASVETIAIEAGRVDSTVASKGLYESPGNKTYAATDQKVIMSQENINTAVDKIPISEKMSIAYDLLSRLSAEDLMLLDRLSEGGFTADEKEAAKNIIYRNFDETEVGYIKELYWEYIQ